jgi:transposase
VRDRIVWKYALGLELTDEGFNYSILSEFRKRLVEGQAEHRLFDRLIEQLVERGLLKARGRQRTDSTWVLGAIRNLNRLELVGETMYHALNSLALADPTWVKAHVPSEWYTRYGKRFYDYQLPKDKTGRHDLAEQIGRDGAYLFRLVWTDPDRCLRNIPAVQVLRRIWLQQYYLEEDKVMWRDGNPSAPPSSLMIASPYALQARYSTKRGHTAWIGYKVHLTEACDEARPRLITHIETTVATLQETDVVEKIHNDLAQHDLLPSDHLVDMGYTSAKLLTSSRENFDVELVGELRPDGSRQASANEGYDQTQFQVDWENKQVICPQGQVSTSWKPSKPPNGPHTIQVTFARATCQACPVQAHCMPPNQQRYEAVQAARIYQKTAEFKTRYRARAGIEGTLSQAVNALDMRRSRYIGLARTHLQHVLTATAINVLRTVNWLAEQPLARTRVSPFQALAQAC